MGFEDGQALRYTGPTFHNLRPSDTCLILVPYKYASGAEQL
jgi:hypothetical protein